VKILVTGGAGFIGSHVVDVYLQHGHEVVVVDDLSTGLRSNLNPAARFYEADIRGPELASVFEKERPECVNHHAAQKDVRVSMADPLFDAEVNVLGSINLLECCRKYGTGKFIYGSSGGAMYGEPEYLPCDENHPVRPLSPYGASKHTVEHYLFIYRANYGLNYTVLRYANVYGPRQPGDGEGGVVAIFARRMLAGYDVTINGDGEQVRDFVYVGDCARANVLALEARAGDPAYDLGSGEGTNINDLFSRLKAITGYAREAVHGPAKLGETRAIYTDASKARRELGWRPEVGLDDGLRQVVKYLSERAAAAG